MSDSSIKTLDQLSTHNTMNTNTATATAITTDMNIHQNTIPKNLQTSNEDQFDTFHDSFSNDTNTNSNNNIDSFIFERNVEDPYFINSIPTTTTTTTNNNNHSHHNIRSISPSTNPSLTSLDKYSLSKQNSNTSIASTLTSPISSSAINRRHTLENLIAPCLDASCSIINDSNTDLNDVDMVYSRRPSTVGLDMALGRRYSHQQSNNLKLTRSYSNTVTPTNYNNNNNSNLMLTKSYTSTNDHNPRILRYYSYADMLSDELNETPQSNNSSRRPSFNTSSQSTPFINTTSNNNTSTFQTNRSPNLLPKHHKRLSNTNFHIESSGSEGFSTDDEDDDEDINSNNTNNNNNIANLLLQSTTSNTNTNKSNPFVLGPRLSRTRSSSTQYFPIANRRRSSTTNQFFINTMNDDIPNVLQTEKVGEILRKRVTNNK